MNEPETQVYKTSSEQTFIGRGLEVDFEMRQLVTLIKIVDQKKVSNTIMIEIVFLRIYGLKWKSIGFETIRIKAYENCKINK